VRSASHSDASSSSTNEAADPGAPRPGLPDHVLVICDGTVAGDSACRLAQRLADKRQAIIRAVAILPEAVRDVHGEPGEPGPIERFLEEVNDQMRRTASMPATWGLTLIVHDVENELRRACAEFDVDTILVPASLRTPEGDVLRAASAAVERTVRTHGRGAPLIVVVAEQAAPVAPAEMPSASVRPDTAALASLSARPEPVSQP
jgi:N-acetylglutamate synthase-like GNAT family acetyltransferase